MEVRTAGPGGTLKRSGPRNEGLKCPPAPVRCDTGGRRHGRFSLSLAKPPCSGGGAALCMRRDGGRGEVSGRGAAHRRATHKTVNANNAAPRATLREDAARAFARVAPRTNAKRSRQACLPLAPSPTSAQLDGNAVHYGRSREQSSGGMSRAMPATLPRRRDPVAWIIHARPPEPNRMGDAWRVGVDRLPAVESEQGKLLWLVVFVGRLIEVIPVFGEHLGRDAARLGEHLSGDQAVAAAAVESPANGETHANAELEAVHQQTGHDQRFVGWADGEDFGGFEVYPFVGERWAKAFLPIVFAFRESERFSHYLSPNATRRSAPRRA